MSAALDEPRADPSDAPSHPDPRGRLLAVRKAGAPFDAPFNLRSERFERLAGEWASASARLAELRERLVDELFRAVPEAGDRGRRRRLLELKRDVHNERPLAALPRGLRPGLRAELEGYSELLLRREAALADARREVFAETRRRIREALEDPRFRLACRYSSPDLWQAIEEAAPGPEEDFSPAERGIYAYAAKLIAKANPFHLFSEVLFPPEAGIDPGGEVEVVFDTDLALDLERRILPAAGDPGRVWMYRRPVRTDGGSHRFWLASSGGSRVVSLRPSERLRSVLSFFQSRERVSGRPTGTRAHWQAHLRASLPPAEREAAQRLLRGLVERGIVVEYLVTDFREFPAQLRGLAGRFDPLLEVLRAWHLAPRDAADLEGLDGELAAAGAGPDRPARYFVNAYGRSDLEPHRRAAEAVSAHLADLAPLFSVEHNFSRSDHVIRSFLRDFVEGRPRRSAPYLEALRHFLRHRDEIVGRYRPWARRSPGEGERLAEWRARLARESGRLGRDRVQELAARARRLAEPRDLCFNGAFDHAEGRFYVSNVFAGRGRFASRYVLRRPAEGGPGPGPALSREALDVELAVPPRPNLNFVVGAHPVGCGFDARFSHRYRRWIDPAHVVVALRDGELVYLEEGSGRRLRFRYRGFLLAQLLPPEYQLLLAGHADAFANPFLGEDAQAVPGSEAGARHEPALVYGPVCLRRERWVVAADEVRGLVGGDDPLRATLLLRERIRRRMRGVDEWYYRLLGGAAERPRPPRFLDLRSPLSVHAFRRDLGAAEEGAPVSLSPMEPPPEHLFEEGGSRFVTELMVEV